MDTSDFSILIGRLEREAERHPRHYLFKAAAVAALAYAPVAIPAFVVLVSLALIVVPLFSGGHPGIFTGLLLLGGIALGVTIVRALWIRIEPPSGSDLTPEEFPAVFAAIDDVVQKMANLHRGKPHVISIDWVTLDREFGISLRQIPQRGLFGDYTNHLQIGVPLLAALSIAELKTVVAHEIGHLGGARTKLCAWVYRQRPVWHALHERFAEPQGMVLRLLARFYSWYLPYADAYTWVLARDHEFAADRAAARATNARVLARALTKIELMGRFLAEVFWKRLFDQVESVPEPKYLPYGMLPRAFALAQKQWSRRDWLEQGLQRFATHADSHPGLGERLAALDVTPELPTQVPDKSALSLLGERTADVLKTCDDEWCGEYLPMWRKRHDELREVRWKIAQYENAGEAQLQPGDLWEKSQLLLDVGQELDAIETLQLLLGRDEKFAKAHLLLGRLLLDTGNERGLKNLAMAAQHDPQLAEEAEQLGYGYLTQRGRKREAQRFLESLLG